MMLPIIERLILYLGEEMDVSGTLVEKANKLGSKVMAGYGFEPYVRSTFVVL